MGRSTDIDIENVEEYEALLEVLRFLNKRCLVKSAHTCLKEVVFTYGDEFSRCERCEEPMHSCEGHDDDPYDRYDMYNDEADFE